MQRDMFPTPHAHPQLQAFEAIESPQALLVHGPAVTAQQDPDAHRTRSVAARARARGYGGAAPSDPALDSFDTRPRD